MKHITAFKARILNQRTLFCSLLFLLPLFVLAQTTIKGTVAWEDGKPYNLSGNVILTLIDPSSENILGSFVVSEIENGSFEKQILIGDPLGDFYIEVSMASDVDAKTNVSVLDLIRLQKHLLGIQLFTNALQVYAGDANNSQSLSALDLIEMRKVIIGINQAWGTKKVMNFFVRTETSPPPIGSVLTHKVTYPENVIPQLIEVNFWAVKTGDVVR